jgi:crotonobetainyl-CoA:carnitine CoA-transferase CaiB-like acyl-CoA transferase
LTIWQGPVCRRSSAISAPTIKIEERVGGDPGRECPVSPVSTTTRPNFYHGQRNKRGITLDLKA